MGERLEAASVETLRVVDSHLVAVHDNPTPRVIPTQANIIPLVAVAGSRQPKTQARYEEIERMYACAWEGCEKAYGTLNHLNAHVIMQSHGPKRTPEQFKEARAAWKARKKEAERLPEVNEEHNKSAVADNEISAFGPPAQSIQREEGSTELESFYPGLAPQPSGFGHDNRDQHRVARPRRALRRLRAPEESIFRCEIKGCDKLFSRSYNLKAHMETHDENRDYPFSCTVTDCAKKFVRKMDLQRHHQSVHMKEHNHKCDYCGRLFARNDTLRRHMEDGCSNRFDVGTLDLRACGYDSRSTASPYMEQEVITEELDQSIQPRLKTSSEQQLLATDDELKAISPILANITIAGQQSEAGKPHRSSLSYEPDSGGETYRQNDDTLSCSTESESDRSEQSWASTQKEDVLRRTMMRFLAWLDARIALACNKDSSPSSSTSDFKSICHAETPGRSEPPSRQTKRGRQDDDEGEENEDDGDGDRRPLKAKKRNSANAKVPKLACPFFKRDHRKYQNWRSCPGPGWDTVHRIKEHLYRRHTLPKYKCYRCCQHFSAEQDLSKHSRAEEPCQKKDDVLQEGLDESQVRKLRSRKREGGREQTECDKWTAMYRTVFPDDVHIPSPYYESQDEQEIAINTVEEYGGFLRRELPPLVRRELRSMMMGEVEEQLQQRIIDMVRNLQTQLHGAFRERCAAQALPDMHVSPAGSAEQPQRPRSPSLTATDTPCGFSLVWPDELDLYEVDNLLFGNSVDFGGDGFLEAGSETEYISIENGKSPLLTEEGTLL
ncbi:hypothetical protein GQ53DRAFT_837335 [Thozetella sp. PMI_491]|nr:hypothetical protein GQ53DRAFT_837335 [Thozetella sp. PMI_491]